MPKAFDDLEKQHIRTALMTAGFRHFERVGVRAARVEDICAAVGIAKGSFYAFFPSKEELFMAIVSEREAQHRADMLAHIAETSGSPVERASALFDMVFGMIEADPILNIVLANDEIAHLIRKLGRERFDESQRADRAFAEAAVRAWPWAAVEPDDLLGLMTLMLTLATQRAFILPPLYERSRELLEDLFVQCMIGDRP